MGGIFDIDSPIMNFLNKVTNIVILNVCFLVSCIPLITIGTALTSLYTVHLKMVRDEESYVFASYWAAFKENFRMGTILWVMLCVIGGIFYVDYRAVGLTEGPIKLVMSCVLLMLMINYLILFLNIFPYVARFSDTLKMTLKNAFLIGIANIGYTIAVALITAAAFVLTFYSMDVFLRALFIWIFFGMSLLVYLQCFLFRRVFDKYIGEDVKISK